MHDFTFSKKILLWHKNYNTQKLPWQSNKTIYTIWLSEIMLQQTQVKTVIPYYIKFIKKFPTIEKLAYSSLDEILHVWSGLGYYTRARNIQKTAKTIIKYYNGIFPEDFNILITLPGIGKSTAGAILSLALNKKYPILDGNIKRILTRYYAIDHCDKKKSIINKELWTLIKQLIPNENISSFNQAMMNLGRLICIPSIHPMCNLCPIQKNCKTYISKNILQYSNKISKKNNKKTIWMLILLYKHHMIWLEKKPEKGIWGGLFSFLEFSNFNTLKMWLLHYNLQDNTYIHITKMLHKLSHVDLLIKPVLINIHQIFKYNTINGIWYNLNNPAIIGLPKPIITILKIIQTTKYD